MSTHRTCTYPDCGRKAGVGWTTCDRHHTAGKSTTQVPKKVRRTNRETRS